MLPSMSDFPLKFNGLREGYGRLASLRLVLRAAGAIPIFAISIRSHCRRAKGIAATALIGAKALMSVH